MADRKLIIQAEFNASGLRSGLQGAAKQVQDFTKSLNAPATITVNANTKNLSQIKSAIQELERSGAAVKVNIDTTQGLSALDRLKQAGLSAARDIQRGFLENVGRGVGNAISGAAGDVARGTTNFLGDSVGKFTEFSGVINEFGAKVGGTEGQLKALSNEALRLGAATSKTPKQAAEAAVAYGKLGFEVGQVTKELPGLVRFAEAAGGEPAKAAELAGNAFKLFGTRAQEAGDIISIVANTSRADAKDFEQFFSDGASAAAAAKQSFADFAAVGGLLRDAGRTAGTAGNDIKILLSRLSTPNTEAAKNAIKELGIEIRDAAGNVRPLSQVIPELQTALGRFRPDKQGRLAKDIFGDEGAPGFLGLMQLSREAIDKAFTTANNAAGATARTSAELLKGLPGALEQFSGSVETIQIKLGQSLSPAIEGLARGGTEALNAVAESPAFDRLEQQSALVGKSLKEALSSKEFGAAATQVVDVLGGAAVDAARDLSVFLKENPQAIAETAAAAKDLAVILAEAAKIALETAKTVVEAIKGARILAAGGAEKVGQENALRSFGATDKDLEGLNKRVEDRFVKETANPFSGQTEEKIRAEEGQRLTDELLARAKTETAKTEAVKQGETARASVKTATNAQANAAVKAQDDSALQAKLSNIDQEKAARQKALADLATARGTVEIGQGGLAIADASGSQRSAELNAQLELQRAISEQQEKRTQSEIEAAKAAGDYSGAAAATNELFAIRQQALNQQQAIEDQIAQVTNEQNLNKAKSAELQAQLNVLTAEEALLKAQSAGASQAEIGILQKKLELSKKAQTVASEGVKSQERVNQTQEKTRETRQQTARESLQRDRDSAIKGVEQEEKRSLESERKKGKAADDRIKKEVDAATKLLELESQRLDLQQKRFQGQANVAKAASDLRVTGAEIAAGQAGDVVRLVGELKEVNIPENVKKTLQNQLGQLGFTATGNQERDQAAAARLKFQQEEQLAQVKRSALIQEQEVQRQLLEIEIKKQQIAAKTSTIKAKGALAEAKASGNAEAISAATEGVKLAQENEAVTAESATAQRNVQALQQQNALAQFDAQDQQRRRQGELELARADRTFVGGRGPLAPINTTVPGSINTAAPTLPSNTKGASSADLAPKLDTLIGITGSKLDRLIGAIESGAVIVQKGDGQIQKSQAKAGARRAGI